MARNRPDSGGHRWFLLWGLENRRLDLLLTIAAGTLLAVSRFALMASGPWEWDETIFARGMLHFELAAHFPQPPGFPGLLALGHLVMPLAGSAYGALQWVSAIASILALWPLALLGRKVAPPAVATSAALLVLLLPGPWLYSVRGFSTWAAVALVLAAAAVWAGGLAGRRVTVFTLLVTAAFLVRPILLPTLALLWLAGVNTIKPIRRIVPGLVAGLIMIGIAVVVMVRLEGSWAAFVEPFVTHADFHTARLHLNKPGIETLGLANGVGGPTVAAALLAAALIGIVVWWRRVGLRAAVTWTVILGLTTGQLVYLQNRSYARYAVGVQVATAPLLAAAASLAPAPVAAASLLGLAGLAGWNTLPLMREQHRERFGAWDATVEAARLAADRGWAVVVEPEVHVFSSYLWSELESKGEVPPPTVLSPRAPEPWLGVHRPWLVATVHPHLYMPSLTGETRIFGRVSEGLEPLTQNRFLSAELIFNPPLPVGQWWTREELPDGTPFMWAGPSAELWLPPVPRGTLIGLAVRPAPGEAPLEVSINPGGVAAVLDGHADTSRLWVRLDESSTAPVIVRLKRASGYPPGAGDDRPLAAQLLGVEVRPPGSAFSGPAATDHDRWRLRLEVEGAYPPEDFGALGRGVWLDAEARLRLAMDEPGQLTLRLASPRPTPANLRFGLAGLEVGFAGELTAGESLVSMFIDPAHLTDGSAVIEVLSDAYVPSKGGDSTDTRSLGVVLLGLSFEPQHPSKGWWSVER
jgi:hypothetical protein